MESPGRRQILASVDQGEFNDDYDVVDDECDISGVFFGPQSDAEVQRLRVLELELAAQEGACAETTRQAEDLVDQFWEADVVKASPSNAAPTETTDASLSRALDIARPTSVPPSSPAASPSPMAVASLPSAPRIAPATPIFAQSGLEPFFAAPSPLSLSKEPNAPQFRRGTTLSPAKSGPSTRTTSAPRSSLPSHAWSSVSTGYTEIAVSSFPRTPPRLSVNGVDNVLASSITVVRPLPDVSPLPFESKEFEGFQPIPSNVIIDTAGSRPIRPMSPEQVRPLVSPFRVVLSPIRSIASTAISRKSVGTTPLASRAPSPAPSESMVAESYVVRTELEVSLPNFDAHKKTDTKDNSSTPPIEVEAQMNGEIPADDLTPTQGNLKADEAQVDKAIPSSLPAVDVTSEIEAHSTATPEPLQSISPLGLSSSIATLADEQSVAEPPMSQDDRETSPLPILGPSTPTKAVSIISSAPSTPVISQSPHLSATRTPTDISNTFLIPIIHDDDDDDGSEFDTALEPDPVGSKKRKAEEQPLLAMTAAMDAEPRKKARVDAPQPDLRGKGKGPARPIDRRSAFATRRQPTTPVVRSLPTRPRLLDADVPSPERRRGIGPGPGTASGRSIFRTAEQRTPVAFGTSSMRTSYQSPKRPAQPIFGPAARQLAEAGSPAKKPIFGSPARPRLPLPSSSPSRPASITINVTSRRPSSPSPVRPAPSMFSTTRQLSSPTKDTKQRLPPSPTKIGTHLPGSTFSFRKDLPAPLRPGAIRTSSPTRPLVRPASPTRPTSALGTQPQSSPVRVRPVSSMAFPSTSTTGSTRPSFSFAAPSSPVRTRPASSLARAPPYAVPHNPPPRPTSVAGHSLSNVFSRGNSVNASAGPSSNAVATSSKPRVVFTARAPSVNENLAPREGGGSPVRARSKSAPWLSDSSEGDTAAPTNAEKDRADDGSKNARPKSKLPRPSLALQQKTASKSIKEKLADGGLAGVFGGSARAFGHPTTNVFMANVPTVTLSGSPSKGETSRSPSPSHVPVTQLPTMFSLMKQKKGASVVETTSPLPSSSPPEPFPSPDDSRPLSPPTPVDEHSSSTVTDGMWEDVSPAEEPNPPRRRTRLSSGSIPVKTLGPLKRKAPALKRHDTLIIEPSTSASATAASALYAPALNATALRNLTTKHTQKNQMYFNVLDRKVELRSGNRPPSPSSKVRTVAQREKEDAEKAREDRVRRRGVIKGEEDTSPERPLKHPRAPGDDDEYSTPNKIRLAMGEAQQDPVARRLFVKGGKGKGADRSASATPSVVGSDQDKAPATHKAKAKNVRWDKLLTSEAPDEDESGGGGGSTSSRSGSGSNGDVKSCLRKDVIPPLDTLGNVPHAGEPLTKVLKKATVVVVKVVYDDDVADEPVVKRARKAKKAATPPVEISTSPD